MDLFGFMFEADLNEGRTSDEPNWDGRGQRYPGDMSPATLVVDTLDGFGQSIIGLLWDLWDA